MATPTRVPERKVWRGDPYELRFVFHNADDTLRDVSGAAWVATISHDAVEWEVDVSEAANGLVRLLLTAEETRILTDLFVSWDLFEENIWARTVFFGRLVMEGNG